MAITTKQITSITLTENDYNQLTPMNGVFYMIDNGNGVEKIYDGNQVIVESQQTMINITYAELKSLRDNAQLVPGQTYRITDYQCTTTQQNTSSAGHVFDIIVTAIDESHLSEEAKAAHHAGDTYFTNSNLDAWKLRYCIDNDTDRFVWADSNNGKGVIYRMIDEFNNDLSYDFKNILYTRKLIKGVDIMTYFERNPDFDKIVDEIQYYCWGNAYYTTSETPIKRHWEDDTLIEGDLIYELQEVEGEEEEEEEGGAESMVQIDEVDDFINIQNSYTFNVYDDSNNTNIDSSIAVNYIEALVHDNIIGPNSYSEACIFSLNFNIFEHCLVCYNNLIENNSCFNIFTYGIFNNKIGSFFQFNIFKGSVEANIIDYGFTRNISQGEFIFNTIENECNQCIFGIEFIFNTIGCSCNNIITGKSFYHNIIGSNCYNIIIGSDKNNLKDYVRYIRINSGVHHVNINTTATTSYSNWLQYIIVDGGVSSVYRGNNILLQVSSVNQVENTYFKAVHDTFNYIAE